MTIKQLNKIKNKLILDYDPNLECGVKIAVYKRPYSTITDKIARKEAQSQKNEFCISIFIDKEDDYDFAFMFDKRDAAQIIKYLNENI